MAFFRRKPPSHFVAVHPDNARKKDWIILLEAGTIVGKPRSKLRVAQTTLERKVARRYSLFLKAQHFLVVDGFDPRIHALYFCPQLYRYDDDKLVPLQGDEIGKLIAQSLESGVAERRPWYDPLDKVPDQPVITTPLEAEFDSVVVEMPSPRNPPTVSSSGSRERVAKPSADRE